MQPFKKNKKKPKQKTTNKTHIYDYFYCKIKDDEYERKELSVLCAMTNPFISLYPLGGYIEVVS